ncbi:dysbindin isoform X2 [Nannospalax galili]|uniref:Dystrobrevin binding protein 1 n=1 Tax=Nannospalax galili TaxID=1026970 RepID=A0A8C6QNN2_NANGA|nr:dysbindin isoform X5 [Nannospalax galili]XP_017653153.1 dysbindin isoform X2 [Nannospalax galili]
MLETLRERLLSVQQDFTSGLKTLSDKSREAKVKSKARTVAYLPKYSAGLELLSRYEDTWAALHRRAKECANAGELVDSEVVMLSAYWEKKRTSLTELQEQLQQLPGLLADLDSMMANLVHLEESFEEVENHLLHLEDLCGQCELERHKRVQSQCLETLRRSRRKELEAFKAELDAEHSQKVLEMEHTQQLKLKERQKFFEEAFQQDMEQYLSTGYLQIAERREPMGSMSSMEVNVDMLEQMDLMDISDQEALDVFLNSGGEDNTVLSPGLEPESDPCQNEITLQVPNPSGSDTQPPASPSACADLDTSDGPLVQSDEEEVQVDTVLATLHTERKATPDVSDDSDSTQDI